MSTIASEAINELLEENGYAHPEAEADARRMIERNRKQRRLEERIRWPHEKGFWD
jgi:hypothetical protein